MSAGDCQPSPKRLRVNVEPRCIRTRGNRRDIDRGERGAGLNKGHGCRDFRGFAGQALDPFFTTKQTGMGMGLAIGRTIIESHEGRIWAVPGDNRGAVVHFTLPLYHES